MDDQISYESRNVAFVDILGFRSLVGSLLKNPSLHRDLHNALAEIRNYKNLAGDCSTAQKEIVVSVFSDSIVISAAEDRLFDVVWSCLGLQIRLLALGILARGGVSRGPTVHNDDMLYGEGMLKAYDLEEKAAIYPRIIVDPNLVDHLRVEHRALFFSQDFDGLWYIDPFAHGVLPRNSEALVEDGYDPHMEFLKDFGTRIEREIADSKDVSRFAKWNWLGGKCAAAIAYHQENGKPRMSRILELAAKKN